MKKIGTKIKETSGFLKREDIQKNILRKLNSVKKQVKLGGGEKAIQRHKAKGKLTARERIDLLLDDPKEFVELSTFAAYEMYEEFGGAASAGTVYGIGKINGKLFFLFVNLLHQLPQHKYPLFSQTLPHLHRNFVGSCCLPQLFHNEYGQTIK